MALFAVIDFTDNDGDGELGYAPDDSLATHMVLHYYDWW